jgi:hypothetical protein
MSRCAASPVPSNPREIVLSGRGNAWFDPDDTGARGLDPDCVQEFTDVINGSVK